MKYIFLSAPCWRWYRSERHWPGWWKRWTIVTILEGVSVCMCVHVFIWEWMNKRENLLFFGCILYLSYFIPHGECWWDSIWIRGHKMTLLTVIYVRFLTFQCINVYIVTTSTFVFLNWKSKWHGEEESSDYVIWYQLFDADDQKNAAYWMLYL